MTVLSPRLRVPRLRVPKRLGSSAIGRASANVVRRHQALPRPPTYVILCATVGVLNIVGLVMILSASSVSALSAYGSSWYFFDRQLIWSVIGIAAFVAASSLDYHKWQRFAPLLLGGAVLLLVLVLVPGVGIMVDGSQRWLGVGAIRVQPSEVAKLALLCVGANVLARRADRLDDWREWTPVLVVLAIFGVLVMLEPDLDSAIVLALIAFSLLVVSGVRRLHLFVLGSTAITLVTVLAFSADYRRARMLAFLHPWEDQRSTGYQIAQSLIAIGSGRVSGVGLGAGRAKWMFLPNAHTDFIFAVIGEELGVIGAFLVLALFAALGLVGFRVARRAPDRFGMLLAAGATAWIVGQAAINLGAVVGLLPVSGITLPFLSVGGSSLVITMLGAGIVANVAAPFGARAPTGEAFIGDRTRSIARPGRPMNEPVFALFAGGGTGGHTYPAVAVAQELVRRGRARESVRFVGARRGIEGRVVPEAGFAIDLFAGRGLQRRLTLANVSAIAGAFSAFVRAIALVRKYRPRIVVGFGGYASLPCVAAARLLRVPTLVHEQDAAPGLANRIAVRLGAHAAVSLPGTPLPGATLTGNPVRSMIAEIERTPAADPALLAVYGGAQGARTINRAAVGCYDGWRHRQDLTVHHVCGPRNETDCRASLDAQRRAGDALTYELVPYEPHMEALLARATLAVCRSGAGTVAELTVAGVPAVLVPLPGSPSDHQARNARTLESAGAAVVVLDEACDPARLDALVSELLADPERLEQMGKSAHALGRPDAAARVADLVEEQARA